jgi:transcriptional regulator with XRE-family HTH domain
LEKIIDRILKIIEAEKMSTRHFEQIIGCSNGVLAKAILKKTDIQSIWVSKIIEMFPVYDAKWLLTGHGNMKFIKEENNKNGNSEILLSLLKEKDNELKNSLVEIGMLREQINNLRRKIGYSGVNIAADSEQF